jgi:hypothetical protein
MFTLLPKFETLWHATYLLFPIKEVHDQFFVMKLKCLYSNMKMKGGNYKLLKFSIFLNTGVNQYGIHFHPL